MSMACDLCGQKKISGAKGWEGSGQPVPGSATDIMSFLANRLSIQTVGYMA